MTVLKSVAAAVLFAAVATGVLLLVYGARMPAYHDPAQARALQNVHPDDIDVEIPTGANREQFTRDWHARMNALRTPKWFYYDLGRGVLTGSATLVFAMYYLVFIRREDLFSITTPSNTRSFLALGSAALLLLIPGGVQYFFEELEREMLPHWADSIGIPIFGGAMMVLVLLPILNLAGYFIALRGAQLPAPLWLWNADAPARSWLWTILFGIPTAILILGLMDAIRSGIYFWPPAFVIGIYLLLSARSAAISRSFRGQHRSMPAHA